AVFRQLVPNYVVREVFATKREELRASAEKIIAEKLGADAILVREVMLSDVALPPEYAKGLEGLLLKEQQNDRMVYDIQIKEKEGSGLMAGAEAHRRPVTALAENERMKLESDLLRANALLIEKIVAERLSDKMQIMMVPMDGRNFFANEIFRAAMPSVDPPTP